jgi:hypothetical protein
MKPTLSVTAPASVFYAPGELPRILELASAADAAGISGLRFVDHVVLGRDVSAYRVENVPSDNLSARQVDEVRERIETRCAVEEDDRPIHYAAGRPLVSSRMSSDAHVP